MKEWIIYITTYVCQSLDRSPATRSTDTCLLCSLLLPRSSEDICQSGGRPQDLRTDISRVQSVNHPGSTHTRRGWDKNHLRLVPMGWSAYFPHPALTRRAYEQRDRDQSLGTPADLQRH